MFLKYLTWSQRRCEILYEPLRIGRVFTYDNRECEPSDLSRNFYTTRLMNIFQPETCEYPGWGYVYVIKSVSGNYEGAYKIGRTSADIYKRTTQSQSYFGCVIQRVWAIKVPGYNGGDVLEPTLHYHFRDKLIAHEWFNLSDSDLDDIRTIPGGFDISHKHTYSYAQLMLANGGAA